ncbi:MAG: aldose 1-epimerase family protein [Phycisphaeraceae bacterium]
MPQPNTSFPANRFESIHQVGGIRTATFDYPDAGGSPACRVALLDTGAGLRFTVALDRGGDVVEAHYNHTNLAYLTPNGYKPPSHAYHRGDEWHASWPGGLVTTCGPRYIGSPRKEDGHTTSQHGQHSNTPAALTAIHQPDPRHDQLDMRLDLLIRDSRMFGPTFEIHRSYHATLGQPHFTLRDTVTNRSDTAVAHNWLYHVNLGYPLLDAGARLVFGGPTSVWAPNNFPRETEKLNTLKTIPEPTRDHAGTNESCFFVDVPADTDGRAHVGLVNQARGVGIELVYPKDQLPRFANWQHFSPSGSYVTGLEPFAGSLVGKANDNHPLADQPLQSGETRTYELTVRIAHTPDQLATLLAHDLDLEPGNVV